MNETFKELKAAGRGLGERLDCSVIAVAATTGASYEQAHAMLKKHGRKDGGRALHGTIFGAIKDLGFTCKRETTTAKTVAKIDGDLIPGRNYIIFTAGHVLAYIDNEVQDWTKGRRHRVIEVYWVKPR